MKKDINPLKNKDGVVLVMVLLILMATIVIGIFLARTSFLETKIAGNEKEYKQTVYTLESSTDWAVQNNSPAFANIGINTGQIYNYNPASLPTIINSATITARLRLITRPPLGSGSDPARFRARYYEISSTQGGHTLTVGVYRVFPKQ
jgi:Tfp pilus assembly protein PilX